MSVLGPSRVDAGGAGLTIGEVFTMLVGDDVPLAFEAYDGSRAGRADAPVNSAAGRSCSAACTTRRSSSAS